MINIEKVILSITNATRISSKEVIQELWSGYGEIIRYRLEGSSVSSLVVKHINLSPTKSHPRGWNTNTSHERKVKSYQNEVVWYRLFAGNLVGYLNMPALIDCIEQGQETLLILSDASTIGFERIDDSISIEQLKLCISWIANLHAKTLNHKNSNLWKKGSYWDLSTRKDELNKMADSNLKKNAHLIASILNNTKFNCLIHGDAKLANFCFHQTKNEVLGLDFQYTGHGCGMKDLVYLFGSVLTSEQCFEHEQELIDFYFKELSKNLDTSISFLDLEKEWRPLFTIAWADFNRFLLGWMPSHAKLNAYSSSITERALNQLQEIKEYEQ